MTATIEASPSLSRSLRVERRLSNDLYLWSFQDRESSHLLVNGDRSLLVDCHRSDLAEEIAAQACPLPEIILHTHIQPEHCHEGRTFPGVKILVHEPDSILASHPDLVEKSLNSLRADLENWETLMGREEFSIAGWQQNFPPQPALNLAKTIQEGDSIPLGAYALKVIKLPGHTDNAVGFLLSNSRNQALAFFCGDLLYEGAYLRDFHSLCSSYNTSRLNDLPQLLRHTASFGTIPWFPSSGSPIQDGASAALDLAVKIDTFLKAQSWTPLTRPKSRNTPPLFGRYLEHAAGIYQINNYGNVILLIDPDGHGLMVDPGPCDFSNPNRENELITDLENFEKVKGLRQIDLILLTHFHGDHIDCTDLIRSRYPGCKVATWSPVADVVERPQKYPYCARLPWYGIGKERVQIDIRLRRSKSLNWRGTTIQTLHLPGHALIHAGYLLRFAGLNLALTGDSVQSNGEAIGLEALIGNHSVPDNKGGCLQCFRTLAAHRIDLNLGGHSSWFTNTNDVYHASLARMEYTLPHLRQLVINGNLAEAFVPSYFPQWTEEELA